MGETSMQTENRPFDEILVCSNIAGALFFRGLLYCLENGASMSPPNDSTYLCLRNMYRVVDFLGLQSQNPVVTSAVRREFPTRFEQLGAEVFVILTCWGITAAATLLLYLMRHTGIYRMVLGLPVLFFAAPICYLCVSCLTWNWLYEPVTRVGSFFTQSLPLAVFLVEILGLAIRVLFFKRKKIPKWVGVSGASLHFIFWGFVLWSETRELLFPIHARGVILALLPAPALMFILRGRLSNRPEGITQTRKRTWRWGMVAIALLVSAGVVWSPARNVELSQPQTLGSVTVELSRGPCRGACPVYTITVHGDGHVQYAGRQGHSLVQTKKSGTIEREKVTQI